MELFVVDPLPFRLKVSGSEQFEGLKAVSTSFRFHGWLRLNDRALGIEWSGQARVQEVGTTTIRDERLPLPAETLIVPYALLARVELLGGWWRPRLEVSARDSRTLSVVPSEEGGRVSFWYARRDRSRAAALHDAIQLRMTGARLQGSPTEDIVHLSDSTPATPAGGHRGEDR